MRSILFTSFLLLVLAAAHAAVVRPAPEFAFIGAGDKARSLRSLRGQAVIVVIADSPKSGDLKRQLKYLEEIYQQLASKQVVLIAAVKSGDGPMPSNIPVAIASNGAGVAAAYGVQKGFQISIIGRDGNLDYQSGKVVPSERVRDVLQNSYEVQASARKAN
ncbi:MAG: hypothetical protein QOE70_5251 [Chthoniobacter sp.]|jgi:hypothetical protein|nr:hypothetical protein [Chthoniobacter sp.]